MSSDCINSPSSYSYRASCAMWIGLLILSLSSAPAQLSQRNTDAVRAPDVGLGAEIFGGLEGKRDDAGTTFAPESPGDADLGEQAIYRPLAEYDPFAVSILQQGLYTSNAALSDRNAAEDFYSYSEAAFRYTPRITSSLFADISTSYGLYRYNDDSSLDFDSLESSAGLINIFSELNNLVAWTNYNYTRLSDAHGDRNELLTEHSIEVGLYYPVPIGEKHFAFGSYLSEFSLGGDPEFTRRDEHGLTFGYAFLPTEKLELSAYYQFFVYDYRERGRLDLLQDVGLAVKWKLTKSVDVKLQTSYSVNDSNILGGDYSVGEAGASLNLAYKF